MNHYKTDYNVGSWTVNFKYMDFVSSIPCSKEHFSFMYEPTSAHSFLHVLYYQHLHLFKIILVSYAIQAFIQEQGADENTC